MSFIFDLEARSLGHEPRAFYPSCNMTLTDYCNIKRYNEVIERHLPHVLGEKKLEIGHCDKIFASQWLTEDLAIVGTKCNKVNELLMVLHVYGSRFIFNLTKLIHVMNFQWIGTRQLIIIILLSVNDEGQMTFSCPGTNSC